MASIPAFLNQGGLALWLIALLAFVLWTLVVMHYGYIFSRFKADRQGLIDRWRAFHDRAKSHNAAVRTLLLSEANHRFCGPLSLIKTVVAVAPLLGLLGTVMGMIEVFDVLSALGTGDARAMASGVARATLPTMAGMVVAILGLFFITRFERFKNRQLRALEEMLGAA